MVKSLIIKRVGIQVEKWNILSEENNADGFAHTIEQE